MFQNHTFNCDFARIRSKVVIMTFINLHQAVIGVG